jgi:hypothetical protein
MNTPTTRRAARARLPGLADDPGGIVSLLPASEAEPLTRMLLLPEEERLSLPPPRDATPGPITPLTRYLGPHLTVASPAWLGDPVPKMRALQKMLVAHSLSLEPSDRSECMEAITIVDSAVRLRLRLRQMEKYELERALKTPPAEATAPGSDDDRGQSNPVAPAPAADGKAPSRAPAQDYARPAEGGKRRPVPRESMPTELAIAIGLVWGHLNTNQFEQAYKLARGCLRIWPQEHRLILTAAYAAVELLEPLDAAAVEVLNTTDCQEWAQLIRHRIATAAGPFADVTGGVS